MYYYSASDQVVIVLQSFIDAEVSIYLRDGSARRNNLLGNSTCYLCVRKYQYTDDVHWYIAISGNIRTMFGMVRHCKAVISDRQVIRE